MLLAKQTYQVADIAAVPTHDDRLRIATIELAGARTVLGVPMLKDDDMVGCSLHPGGGPPHRLTMGPSSNN